MVTMYDRSCTVAGVNAARLDMFARKQKPYEAIPSTRAALLQHAKRAAYRAGCIWSQSTVRKPEAPSRLPQDGQGTVTCGRSSGRRFHQLLRVANNSPSVAARQNVVTESSATSLACSALHCVAADVNISVRRWTIIFNLRW